MKSTRSSSMHIRINPEAKAKAKPVLTENGYTPEFEAKILAEAEEMYAAVANGTAKIYKSVEEMFAEWDREDAEGDD